MIKIVVKLAVITVSLLGSGFEASPSPAALLPTQESLLSYLGRVMMYNFHPPSLFLADKKEDHHGHGHVQEKAAALKTGNCRHSKALGAHISKDDDGDGDGEFEKEGKSEIWRGRRPSLKPQMSAKFRHSAKVDDNHPTPTSTVTNLTGRKAPSTLRRTTPRTTSTTITPPPPSTTPPLSGGFPGDDDSAESAIVQQVLMDTQILRQHQKVPTNSPATISTTSNSGVMTTICNRICR